VSAQQKEKLKKNRKLSSKRKRKAREDKEMKNFLFFLQNDLKRRYEKFSLRMLKEWNVVVHFFMLQRELILLIENLQQEQLSVYCIGHLKTLSLLPV